MQTIKVQVRIECPGTEDSQPVAFWREGEELCCLDWSGVIMTTNDEFMLSLPMAYHFEAVRLVESLQRHYDSLEVSCADGVIIHKDKKGAITTLQIQ